MSVKLKIWNSIFNLPKSLQILSKFLRSERCKESGFLFLLLLSCSQLISDIRHTPAVAAFLIPSVSALFRFRAFRLGFGCLFSLHGTRMLVSTCTLLFGFFIGVHGVVFRGFFHFDSKGAKEWQSCRSRKTVKNAPTLAIGGLDTDENEPSKVCPLSVYRSPR